MITVVPIVSENIQLLLGGGCRVQTACRSAGVGAVTKLKLKGGIFSFFLPTWNFKGGDGFLESQVVRSDLINFYSISFHYLSYMKL